MPVRGLCAGVSGGINGASAASLTSVLSLPGSAVAGDVVAVCCTSATGSNTATAVINGHSLTARSSPVTQSTTLRGYCFTYTLVAGDIGQNITITWTGTSARCLAVGVVLFQVDESSIAIGTAFGVTTGNITPPPVTVSAGTAADVLIMAASRTNSTTVVATYTMPSGYTSDVYGALAFASAPEQAMFIGHLTAPALGSTTVTPGAVVIANSPTNSLAWTIGMQKVTLARSASDAASPADSVTQAISLHAVASDTASSSDTAARTATAYRAAADSASATDSATRAGNDSRAANDSASPSDSASHGPVAASRTAADGASPADSAGRSWAYTRAASDTSSATDIVTRSQSSTRAAADTASPADAAVRASTRTRSAADVASPSDSATATYGARARAAADLASPTDNATRGAETQARTATDTAAPGDSASRTSTRSRAAADVATPADAAARSSLTFGRFVFDVASPADLAARAEHFFRAALDVATPNDSVFVFRPRDLHLSAAAAPDRWAVAASADRWDAAEIPDRWTTLALEDA